MSELVISAESIVVFHVTMTLQDGSAADSTKVNNKPAKVQLGDGSLSPAFEAQLMGLQNGDKKAFMLPTADAFGEPNPDNIYHLDRSRFGADMALEVGAIIQFDQPDGRQIPGVVRELAGESVTIDFNHPLAGEDINFDIEIVEVLQ